MQQSNKQSWNAVSFSFSFSLSFNRFTPRVNYGDIKVVLTFESVNEILWCDHSSESY